MQLFFCPFSRKFPVSAKMARNVTGCEISPGNILPVTFTRAAKRARITVRKNKKWELHPGSSQKKTKKYKITYLRGGYFLRRFPPTTLGQKVTKIRQKNVGISSAIFLKKDSLGNVPSQKWPKMQEFHDAFLRKQHFWRFWSLTGPNAKNAKMYHFGFLLSP